MGKNDWILPVILGGAALYAVNRLTQGSGTTTPILTPSGEILQATQPTARTSLRQGARTDRVEARQDAATERTELRQEGRSSRTSERQTTIRHIADTAASTAQSFIDSVTKPKAAPAPNMSLVGGGTAYSPPPTNLKPSTSSGSKVKNTLLKIAAPLVSPNVKVIKKIASLIRKK